MKKYFAVLCFIFICFCSFAKELESSDLAAVNKVLDARLHIYDVESFDDKIAYLKGLQHEVDGIAGLSEEARFICEKSLNMQIETVNSEETEKQNKNHKRRNLKNSELEQKIMKNFDDFVVFEENHQELSAHFYMRKLEAEMTTLPFLNTNKQIKFLSGLLDAYKGIEEMNGDYAENLFTMSTILYFVPKVAGGSKEKATEKCLKAIKTATCDYEKASSMVMYSQILFEAKNYDEAKIYLDEAIKLDPQNKNMQFIKKMNADGYSMFRPKNMEKYEMN